MYPLEGDVSLSGIDPIYAWILSAARPLWHRLFTALGQLCGQALLDIHLSQDFHSVLLHKGLRSPLQKFGVDIRQVWS